MASQFDLSTVIPIANLIQGVSQQAEQQRRDAQCDSQFDCINSVSDGCQARPPTELVRTYPGLNLTGSFFSETFNGDNENYLTGVRADGVPFAYDLSDGTPCTVTSTAPDLSYLTSGAPSPREKLRGQVVDDFTFMANRQVTVAMAGTQSAAKVNEAIVFLKATSFGTRYRIGLSGPATLAVAISTADTQVAPTQGIAQGFLDGIDGPAFNVTTDPSGSGIDGNQGYTCTRSGSTLRIRRTDGEAFTVSTEDGNGDTQLYAFNGEAQSFSRLPERGFTGSILKVGGENKTQEDDFYVKYIGASSTGRWQETVGPGVKTTINPATMPHALVNTGFRTFEFRRLAWSTRIAGDESTAKDPSFVGKKLRDVSFFNRRLVLLHMAGVVFSKTDNPYTYFPDTLQTTLATAPVDLKVSSGAKNGAAVLDFAVLAAESLFLWAQKVQFRVSSGQQSFEQKTVENLPAMAYEYSPNAHPLALGPMLYMSTDAGPWATLRTLQFSSGKLIGDTDVSAHIGQYIPAGVRILTASETLRQIFMQTDGSANTLVLFNYTFDGDSFIQTAFNTWRIPGGTILWTSISNNKLRILQQRPEGVALLSVDLTPKAVDPQAGAKYKTRLDNRVAQAQVTGLTYNSTTDTTSFTLPYIPTGTELRVVLADTLGARTRGRVYEVVSVVGAVVTVKGNLTGGTFYAGQRIVAERTESEFFIRGESGAEPTDRLTINKFQLSCSDTGYSRIESIPDVGPMRVSEYPARVLGSSSAVTGPPNISTDDFDIDVSELAKEVTIRLVNDSFLPSNWQSAAYDITAVGWKGGK